MANLKLGLLGPLQVLRADAPITNFESDKMRALLVYLAVDSAKPHPRETVLSFVWIRV